MKRNQLRKPCRVSLEGGNENDGIGQRGRGGGKRNKSNISLIKIQD